MALREVLGASSGELMREDAITGGRMTRIFATLGGVGGVLLDPLWLVSLAYSAFLMSLFIILADRVLFKCQ